MRTTIFIASLALFGSGVTLSFLGSVSAATVTYGAAVLSLIFVFLPEFKKFKGLGIEAELLDRKIEEADRLLSQLRDLAVPIAEMLWSSAARVGRWDSAMPRAKRYSLVERIERELLKCGVTPAQLEQAKVDWHYYNLHDLCSPVLATITTALQPHLQEREEQLSSFPQPITPDTKAKFEGLVEHRNVATRELAAIRTLYGLKDQLRLAETMRSTIADSEVLGDTEKKKLGRDLSEAIQDIEYYAQHREFRRLEAWLGQETSERGGV